MGGQRKTLHQVASIFRAQGAADFDEQLCQCVFSLRAVGHRLWSSGMESNRNFYTELPRHHTTCLTA